MKKIITIVLVMMLITSMTIPAHAAGNIVPVYKGENGFTIRPITFKMPSIKTVDISYSTVYENAKTAIQSNVLNNWIKTHPWK